MGWRDDIRTLALKQVGKPYRFGAEIQPITTENPKYFDCSELVEWLYYHATKIRIVDGSYNQYDISTPVKELKIGDLGFKRRNGRIYHVAMYVGNGEVVNAMGAKWGVVKQSRLKYQLTPRFAGWRRPNEIVYMDKVAARLGEQKAKQKENEAMIAKKWALKTKIVQNKASFGRKATVADVATMLKRFYEVIKKGG